MSWGNTKAERLHTLKLAALVDELALYKVMAAGGEPTLDWMRAQGNEGFDDDQARRALDSTLRILCEAGLVDWKTGKLVED